MDGTGDGDGGNDMWVMGTPNDGCGRGRDPAAVIGVEEAGGVGTIDDAGGTVRKGGTENNSDIVGAGAGSAEMPS
jgi:hypothetical protein